jgi:hypothetical protein
MNRRNVLHTGIENPADADAIVEQYSSSGAWRVQTMGWVPLHGYWILFEAVE